MNRADGDTGEVVDVRESTVALPTALPSTGNLTDAVFDTAVAEPGRVGFTRRVAGEWQPVTARDFAQQVRDLAAGLVAAGVRAGDRVALMSRTRYEWTLADYAIWTAGAVTVPVYETSSAEQLEWIAGDSGAVAIVVESPRTAALVAEVRHRLPALREVWQVDAGDLDALAARGGTVPYDEVEQRRRAVGPDDLATVIYTSGTTGRPKGCELTHGNFLARCLPVTEGLEELFHADASTLLFLPLAHIFGRIVQVACVLHRVRLGYTSDVATLADDLRSFAPTFVAAVPRVFEKVYAGARQQARADGAAAIFDRAADVAVRYSEALDGAGPGLPLRLAHGVFDRLVYRRLRDRLGGRLRYAASGGAPLSPRLAHFFRGAGVVVLEGYGLTETTAGGTSNIPTAMRIGTVGRGNPGTQIRIADDGEVLLRGGYVFGGYWHAAAPTAEVLDSDGWLHTGDLGRLDADGYLTITGRKKELIVTAGGKNVAPGPLEDRMRQHPLVSQCLVVGEGRPYVAALVTLDAEELTAWGREHRLPADAGPEDVRDHPALRAAVQEAVDEANRAVSRAEGIRRFAILPADFTEAGGELTPSLKVRRQAVLDRYADQVAALYR